MESRMSYEPTLFQQLLARKLEKIVNRTTLEIHAFKWLISEVRQKMAFAYTCAFYSGSIWTNPPKLLPYSITVSPQLLHR